MSFERQTVPCSMSCRPLFYVHTPRKTHTWRGLREPKRFKHCCYLNNNKNTAEKLRRQLFKSDLFVVVFLNVKTFLRQNIKTLKHPKNRI